MPTFNYSARDLQGIDHKGTIETTDSFRAAKLLSKKGLVVISIKEHNPNSENFIDSYLHRISYTDLVVATRQLATMIESGLVLTEALDILVDQQANPRFKKVLSEVSRDIKSGLDLASAFRKHPDVFPSIYSSLIKAGEKAGNLDIVLTQMALSMEKEREFRSKLRGAMIYPAIIMIMMLAVMLIMIFFVVPRLTSLYTQSNLDLPLPTKILIAISNFMISFWWIVVLIIVAVTFLFKRWVKTEKGKTAFDQILLKVPVISRVIRGAALVSFTRTFGLLTTAGIPLLDALTIVADVIGNNVYKKAIKDTFDGVEKGLTLSAQLEVVNIFPKIVPQMFRVGEETGKIDQVSFKMADYFESESDQLVKNLTVLIEPIVLVVLGVGVAFLVLSIILPIYKLTTSFS